MSLKRTVRREMSLNVQYIEMNVSQAHGPSRCLPSVLFIDRCLLTVQLYIETFLKHAVLKDVYQASCS